MRTYILIFFRPVFEMGKDHIFLDYHFCQTRQVSEKKVLKESFDYEFHARGSDTEQEEESPFFRKSQKRV
jgi:hypothetical protein